MSQAYTTAGAFAQDKNTDKESISLFMKDAKDAEQILGILPKESNEEIIITVTPPI
jgi:hypothetical protein